MILKGNGNPGPTVRGPTVADADFSLAHVQRDTLISTGGSTSRTDRDSEYTDDTPATVDRVSDLTATETVPGTFATPPTFTSLDPSIATVDEHGRVARVTDGTARVIVSTRLVKRRADISVARIVGTITTTFDNFVAGSLARHCTDAVDSRIAGKSAATAKSIHNGTTYNALRWTADIDLACLTREIPRGTLVSPRHIVGAEHYQPGASVTFLAADGTIVARTVTSRQNVGLANAVDNYATDVVVCLLDSDVPASIGFAKVLPSAYADHLPGITNGIPGLCLDQDEQALVGDLFALSATRATFRPPTDAQRLAFYEPKISGDSGNPALLLINGEPVIVTTWTFGGAGSGPNYAAIAAQINAAMTTLGGGYQLTEANLTGFAVYA